MHFADHLLARTQKTSPACIGLDPALEKLPEDISKDANGVLQFCRGIIDATKDVASTVKPQLAYFEILRADGMKVFWDVCDYAKQEGFIVIADGKRNDIGTTCEAYADAYLSSSSPVDALTVSPYLGSDGVMPFVDRAVKNEKGIFVLVKTSNPSSGELQDLPLGDEVVHEHMAQLTEGWARQHLGSSNLSLVGAVVGATYPEELKYLRTLMPHTPFLIPGYGAQGGSATDVTHGFLSDGTGAVVNASRSIIFASKGNDWQEKAREAAQAMAEDLAKALTTRT
jgi:orotidine-5'-phosphate decarboxylase